MEEIKEWISGICAISLGISILKSLLPKTAVGKVFNISAAILLVIAVVLPIKKFDLQTFEISKSKSEDVISEKVEKVRESNAIIMDDIISDKLCEYICNKTGFSRSDILITCKDGEIKKVILYKNNYQVREILKNECGISEKLIEQG